MRMKTVFVAAEWNNLCKLFSNSTGTDFVVCAALRLSISDLNI